LNLLIVFIVSGLWHGAAWTFVAWGALHGLYLVASLWLAPLREKFERAVRLDNLPTIRDALYMLGTFQLVSFAWIFFRANSISDGLYISAHLFRGLELQANYGLGLGFYDLAIALLAILVMEWSHLLEHRGSSLWEALKTRPVWLRWAADYSLLFAILLFGRMGTTEFIYFQF
jgi:D-alanyl-lipoteichoic acid acyltransferase DltB (MBOAT superfamily)